MAICLICGEIFEPKRTNEKICQKDHFRICPICGKTFIVPRNYRNRKTCSKDCSKILRKQNAEITSLEKYGVKNAGYSSESQKKIKATNLEKYGVEYSFQSEHVKNSIKQTMKSRYGVENPMQIQQFKAKAQCTNLSRYGSVNPLCKDSSLSSKIDEINMRKYGTLDPGNRPEAKEKRKRTNLERYGCEYPTQNLDILEFRRSNYHQKYGVDCPFQNKEVIDKSKETSKERYGYEYPIQSPEVKSKLSKTILNKYGVPWPCMLGENRGPKISKVNKEFGEFLNFHGIQFEYEFPINSKQYDFKLINSNIVIELDPSQTHSIHDTHFGAIPRNYHCMKSYTAEQAGYRCIHVFDWDSWDDILQIIKTDMILEPVCDLIECDKSKYFDSSYLETQGYEYAYTKLPTIHWSKNRRHIIDSKETIYQDMINNWWYPVPDCGYDIYTRRS